MSYIKIAQTYQHFLHDIFADSAIRNTQYAPPTYVIMGGG